jgi:hypothetical protein
LKSLFNDAQAEKVGKVGEKNCENNKRAENNKTKDGAKFFLLNSTKDRAMYEGDNPGPSFL